MSVDSPSPQPRSTGILPSNVQSVEAITAVDSSSSVSLATQVSSSVAVLGLDRQCPNCHRSWGVGRSCQFCRQVEGLPIGVTLASPAKRFGGWIVDALLVVVTLFVGYFVWSLISFTSGRTPGKQLLGMRYVHLDTGRAAGWGRTFLREVIAKAIVGVLCSLTFGIAYFWLIWDRDNQELWDKVVGTVVVNDPHRQLT